MIYSIAICQVIFITFFFDIDITGFKPQKVPENIDTIVIGSGISGLTTAVLLGRAGSKVLVLEQHDQAGGCCHTFVDKGYEFDTGKNFYT